MNEEKLFEIWSEGFVVTGGSSNAHLHTIDKQGFPKSIRAKSFEEALLKWSIENKDFHKYLDYRPNAKRVKGSDYTYWGCRLFDNEEEARESFG